MNEVSFIFVGAGSWNGDDEFPFPVSVPRVPVVGDQVRPPDELGAWRVAEVEFNYSEGLIVEPTMVVRCERPPDSPEEKG